MSSYIPKEQLTAYQRWELAAFDEAEREAKAAAEAAAAVVEEPVEIAPPLPTAEEIEQIVEDARQSGFATGLEEGRSRGQQEGFARGFAEGNAQALAQAERLAALVAHLGHSVQVCEQHLADQLLDLSLEIARQVLRQTLNIKRDAILPAVREAIAALPLGHGHPLLFLHPDDAPLVREKLGDALTHAGWKLVEDLHIEAGGCRVELAGSEVDATIATRWQRVVANIGADKDWLDPPA